MADAIDPDHEIRSEKITLRLSPTNKARVVEYATNQGLGVASCLVMLLVKVGALPASCIRKVKRAPVKLYVELHSLLGELNKIGGNCKQLGATYPDLHEINHIYDHIALACFVITEKLQGQPVPEGVNLYALQKRLVTEGRIFNQIVKSVNCGKPCLVGLEACLNALCLEADRITAAMTGQPYENNPLLAEVDQMERAMAEMRKNLIRPDK